MLAYIAYMHTLGDLPDLLRLTHALIRAGFGVGVATDHQEQYEAHHMDAS
jgi:hypothetical protein